MKTNPAYSIHKVKGQYRIRFKSAPYWNANRATRPDAITYAEMTLARLERPIGWPLTSY